MELKPENWKLELERKYVGATLEELLEGLELLKKAGYKVTPLFSGQTRTWWLNHNLPHGTSARIRKAMSDSGEVEHAWTIKKPAEEVVKGAKLKLEYEDTAPSFNTARSNLVSAVRSTGIVHPDTTLVTDMDLLKDRTSFLVQKAVRNFRLDADDYLEVKGEKVKTDIQLVEIEDISKRPGEVKLADIIALGELMNLRGEEKLAGFSTKKLLAEFGERH